MASRAVDRSSRRYDPAETRQRVLEAANLLFSTKGFAATGTADIARAADVSEGSIFYHFGSKKNLLVDIGRMYGERMIAVMQGDDALEDLEPGIMITRCINFCIEHREWETLTGETCGEGKPRQMMAADAEPFYRASREVMIEWVIRQMTAAMAKRHVAGVDVPVAAGLIYAIVGEAIDAVVGTEDTARRATVLAETIRFVRTACGYVLPPADAGVRFRGEATILDLGPAFYDPVAPADFPATVLRFRNDAAAAEIGLDGLDDADWVRHFGRFVPLPDSLATPLALRYHGHQFRVYNPDLGDGRGFLFAQCRDDRGRLLDLGTKGSGTTPWSRAGDGRLTLKGAVREVLATEMLAALGVETSRTLSVIETGEALDRGDEPSPTRSAVLVRLSHSHIRYGTFQRLAALGLADDMARLTTYVLTNYFDGKCLDDPYATLIDHAVTNAARQAAALMAAGFVHGVLNTDNINITGECFDYGPFRFAPTWDGDFTAAYFDHHGLYSFGRQAEAFQWNVFQLAAALRLVAPVETLRPALAAFGDRYAAALTAALLARLGVVPFGDARDGDLAEALVTALAASGAGLDRFWFDWRGGRRRSPGYGEPAFDVFVKQVGAYAPAVRRDHAYWSDAAPCGLPIAEVEAIWAAIAERDDWGPVTAKVAAIRRMGEAMHP